MEPLVVAHKTTYIASNLKSFPINFPLSESNLLTCLLPLENCLPPSFFVERFKWSHRTFITPWPVVPALCNV